MKFLHAEDGFLGLSAEDAVAPELAKAIIIPFGLERTVSFGGGTAKGPSAILKASHQVELFDEELWNEPFRQFGIATLKEPKIKKKLSKALDQLEEIVAQVLALGKFPMVLGGEHSLTAGAIRPFVKAHKKVSILHFDAHADLRDGYDGEHFSHAAALRRCCDHPNINLVQIGIRNISAGEVPFYEENRDRIHIFWGKDRKRWDVKEIVAALKGYPVYVSFDLDGFDASLMPATGTPEPGGVFWEDAVEIIRAAAETHEFIGADVVELAPIKNYHACDFLAAKLVYKILAYAFMRKQRVGKPLKKGKKI